MKPNCMRCGECCGYFPIIIPKTESSDLTESFINAIVENDGMESLHKYMEENSEPNNQGKDCKWLIRNLDKTTSCKVHNLRASCCSNHRKDEWCNIGLSYWLMQDKIPKEILDIIKVHPNTKMLISSNKEFNKFEELIEVNENGKPKTN